MGQAVTFVGRLLHDAFWGSVLTTLQQLKKADSLSLLTKRTDSKWLRNLSQATFNASLEQRG